METYSVTARRKPADLSMGGFISQNFSAYLGKIDSVFGAVEKMKLYGGRTFLKPDLTAADIQWVYNNNLGYRITVSTVTCSEDEYQSERPFFEKYHRHGNSTIIANDNLARWVKRDFPSYTVEASAVKWIATLNKVEEALKLYDQVILPAYCNDYPDFLKSIKEKNRIRLFANAGCAYNCPARTCYGAISKQNRATSWQEFGANSGVCSKETIPREDLGFVEFDIEKFKAMGFSMFKVLQPQRP